MQPLDEGGELGVGALGGGVDRGLFVQWIRSLVKLVDHFGTT